MVKSPASLLCLLVTEIIVAPEEKGKVSVFGLFCEKQAKTELRWKEGSYQPAE
ncbi:hypothetical protein [Rufibacter ruber]|uniref:hypothetical protein n=1 Tax=Rufibacter ruber TaxID=1783499 RepID=UPI00137B1FCC|nr:hypothetical protein [Rufibacter ruber]